MLSPAGVEVECRRIRHITSRIIRHDRDVIADLVLVRPTLSGIKGLAHRNVCRPANTAIGAVRIEQLREKVGGIVARVVPYGVKSPIRRD